MRMYLNGEIKYGKRITVIFRVDGDGIVGDGLGVFDPGDEYYGMTYDHIFNELKDNGSFEVP